MRLPIIDGDASKIDEPLAIKMIRYAIDKGVNYVDTAYVYHRGNSEVLVGKALKDGYRDKVSLATKMPSWLANSQDDMDRYLNEQLSRLQVDYIDFYLIHDLRKQSWKRMQELEATKWAEKKIQDGKIRYLGFSFHDEYEVFKDIIDSYAGWTFCQIQYNYSDTNFQAGRRGLKCAASKGLAVVVMEPIAGGRLAVNPPPRVQILWDQAGIGSTKAELALRWIWNQPEVSVALSGMSTMSQVVENVASTELSDPGNLTEKEVSFINRLALAYRESGYFGCTDCKYCMPCPQGVNIPQIIAIFNQFYMNGQSEEIRKKYWNEITPESQAKRCIRCRTCEPLCPQHLPISDIMTRAGFMFDLNR